MKKSIIHLLLLILICIHSADLNANSKIETRNIERSIIKSIDAYVFYQGNWVTGTITYEANQQGYTLISYNFSQVYLAGGQTLSGYFYDGQRFTPLNPNSEMAKRNNFTHYIDIQGIRAFIISGQ